ncbi:hypothetical protein B0T25DRAFT_604288 [Lasiosphaeria hispida]|uniref:HTH CENPB-type domain-containing protein n=1 Tax=Lasiosphaeria hispida TaxID=260671 RepID=A0AAJ0MGF7_9PEZI|nr:hypothetical protein B0T25DRAFT_604288 [Lasiosphaeria hispida]
MHNHIIGSTAMDQENHLAHDNTYGNDNWVDMNSYHHQTTMPDYATGYSYIPPITHGLPSESLGRMPPPPPPQSIPQSQATHTQLPMLMMPPHATWPSMLTNPNSFGGSHPAPPVAIPPVTAPLKASKLPAIQTTSQPRKTLTDEDRRAMCQYAEDHPGVKQTDIGARFGVERSTVSKVLRHKEKYLGQEDRSSSPIKRTKGKGVDIEKALTNYLRNAQKTGIAVTGDDLKEKARLFSLGSAADNYGKTNSSAWLDKFMLKHGIGQGKLMRRASETNIPDSARGSPSLTASQPSSAISPASPSGHLSPSPLSANRSDEEKESINNFMDFTSGPGAYKHSNSQSTTSLSSAFTDTAASSFSGSALSPTASFNFSPDPNVGAFLSADQSRHISHPGGPGSNFQRPRSQTFPTLDLEYMNQPQSTEPLTPKYHISSTAPSSALESPSNEVNGPHFNLDHAVTSPQLRHSNSNGSLAGRSSTTPAASAVGSSPNSPTQEDARRAADTLLSFIQNASGFVDHQEYLTVVRLTEKLRIHQNQLAKAMSHGMGGLSRIPEGDSEMPNAPPTQMVKVETTMGA